MTDGDEIGVHILAFYESLAADPNHRYRSWEHCFGHFRKRLAHWTVEERETAALHLAFYLATWGMYRGSSALLWKDYKIHLPAISKLLDPRFETLWDLNFTDAKQDNATAVLIVTLSDELRQVYQTQMVTVNGNFEEREPSEILITKVLLGTVGCTPACDRFFVQGFRQKLRYSEFGEAFLCRAFQFYRSHEAAFLQIQKAIIQRGGVYYPAMKLVDMYFWKLGFNRFNLLPKLANAG